jgi:fatty acid desaturase
MVAFLDRHRDFLMWCHSLLTLTLCAALPVVIAFLGWNPAWIFLSSLIGFCQNIGLMHEMVHRRLKGPRWIGQAFSHLHHAVGGLQMRQAKFLHLSHHKYLGTDLDPDRLGYLTTKTFFEKARYLIFIGPLRKKFAPVDFASIFARLEENKKNELRTQVGIERLYNIAFHLCLLVCLREKYLLVFAALICANILSNIREVSEHGDFGRAAYVNLKPGLFGILFLSTPGFWYHGVHHMHPEIHYLSTPLWSSRAKAKGDLRYVKSRSVWRYFLSKDQ